MIHLSKSPHETQKLGADFVQRLVSQKDYGKTPVQVDLIGDVGAGKTTFVQGMARGLGVDSQHYISSPTFTMIHQYGNLIHVDLYRVEKAVEFTTLGLEDYLAPGNILVIEWGEKGPKLTGERIEVRFEIVSEKERRIRVIPAKAGI